MTADPGRSLSFQLGRSDVIVSYADITTLPVDVLVSSDDTDVSMGGGVSAAIRGKGGEVIYKEAQQAPRPGLGGVVVTSAGSLPVKLVFHALVIDYSRPEGRPTSRVIRAAVRRCLELCEERGARSIAFPALATGTAQLPPEESAAAILVELRTQLEGGREIDRVHLALEPRAGERAQLFFLQVQQYLELSAAQTRVAHAVAGASQFAPSALAETLTPDRARLADAQATLDAGMIAAGTKATEVSLDSGRKSLAVCIDALDSKFQEALRRSASDPGNVRLQADVLRVQIEHAFQQRRALEYAEITSGASAERQKHIAALEAQEAKARQELNGLESQSKPVVISLHGIRTRGAWQKDISPRLSQAGFEHELFDYGRFGLLGFIWPPSRKRRVIEFRDRHRSAGGRGAQGHPSIIAHSFGTLIVTRAMAAYQMSFDQVVFCGAIVKPGFDWDTMFKAGRVKRVLNDHGRLDLWARVARYIVAEAGQSGLTGFDPADGSKIINRDHKQAGHSDYFYDLNYTNGWIPFLRGESPDVIPNVRDRRNWHFAVTMAVLAIVAVAMLIWWF